MLKEDKVQVSVLVDAQKGINELGKLELEAKEVASSMKRMKKGSEEFSEASTKLDKANARVKELRASLDPTAMTMNQLSRYQRQLNQAVKNEPLQTDKYKQLQSRLVEINAAVRERRSSLRQTRQEAKELTSQSDLASASLKQLAEYQKRLNDELADMKRGTKAYADATKEFQKVDKALKRQQAEISGTNRLWAKLSAEVKQFGALAIGYLGFEELVSQVGNFLKSNADLSDSIADVMKTTNLTRKEVEDMNKSFKKVDTRTSRRELLELARVAGKLGVQGKENIEGFVRAADKIVVALGEDLGGNAEDTIRQVGKLVDVFKVKEEFGLEEGLEKVGSAINSLGAASTANEGYLVDFAKRLGGIAPNANISIDQVLGLAATLDQLGQTSEVSSTALGQLLVSFANDLPAFSKLAGKSVEEFSTILEEDANEALLMVLEGAKSTKNGLSGMAETLTKLGVDGARAASVVGVLSNNVELLRGQQALANKEFKAGNSLTKEFAVKNKTLGASLDKVRKAIAGFFTNSKAIKVIERMVQALEKAVVKTETVRDRLVVMRREFNREMEVLQSGNFTLEQRQQLISRINEKYGEYLPRLINEKDSLSDIAKIQEQVNKNILSRIILMDYEKEMEKIYRDQKAAAEGLVAAEEARAELTNSKLALNDGLTPGQREQMLGTVDAFSGINQAIVDNTDDRIKELEGRYAKMAERLGVSFQKIKSGIDFGGDATPEKKSKAVKDAVPEPGNTKTPDTDTSEYNALIQRWKQFKQEIDGIQQEQSDSLQSAEVKQILSANRKYAKMREMALKFYNEGATSEQGYKKEIERINELHGNELERIQEESLERQKEKEEQYRREQKAKDEQAKQEAIDREVELWELKAKTLSEFSGLISATNNLIAQQGAEQAGFQKQLALVQIAVDTASSISSAIAGATKAAAATPGAPFVLLPYIISMTTSVISAFAKAQKVISGADAPSPPKFKGGGGTGKKGIGIYDDEGDEIAGLVHPNEYVIPEWLPKQNPFVADLIPVLEAMRLKKGVSMPDSSPPPSTPSSAPIQAPAPQQSRANDRAVEVLSRMEGLLERIEQNGIAAYFTREEAEDSKEYLDKIDKYRKESSL